MDTARELTNTPVAITAQYQNHCHCTGTSSIAITSVTITTIPTNNTTLANNTRSITLIQLLDQKGTVQSICRLIVWVDLLYFILIVN